MLTPSKRPTSHCRHHEVEGDRKGDNRVTSYVRVGSQPEVSDGHENVGFRG